MIGHIRYLYRQVLRSFSWFIVLGAAMPLAYAFTSRCLVEGNARRPRVSWTHTLGEEVQLSLSSQASILAASLSPLPHLHVENDAATGNSVTKRSPVYQLRCAFIESCLRHTAFSTLSV